MTNPAHPDPAPAVGKFLAAMDTGHPRLLLTAEESERLLERTAGDPLLQGLADHVVATAEGMLILPPSERKMKGHRLLDISRQVLKRILNLAMAHRLTGDPRYADRAREEMLAVAGFTDWNPDHFLDVAEMTAALGIGYDWLYDHLTLAERRMIREAIVGKGLEASFGTGGQVWWIDGTNNWNPVCHGGLSLGAMGVHEDHPELAARIIGRAVEKLPLAMEEYAPDGAYPEGPGYWDYGTTFSVLFIDALEKALGTDFGLTAHPGFLESSDYMLHVEGPSGLYFNYSDNGENAPLTPALHWFAGRRGKPELLWNELPRQRELVVSEPISDGRRGRFHSLILIWYGPDTAPIRPEPTHWSAGGHVPVAFHRSGWDADATYLGVKGGSPAASHGHMDIGTFVLDMRGERWVGELRARGYNDLEQRGMRIWDSKAGSDRWKIFAYNNAGHSTLTVDGRSQLPFSRSPITKSAGEPEAGTTVNLTPAYEGQVESAVRTVRLLGEGRVSILDAITAPDRPTTVRWTAVVPAEIERIDATTAILRKNGKSVRVEVDTAATTPGLEALDLAKPPNEWDRPTPGTHLLRFDLRLEPGERVEVTVTFTALD